MVRADGYVPSTLDLPHDEDPDYYLVQETPAEYVGNGIVKFSRAHYQIPQSYKTWETYSYTVPGIDMEDSVRIFSITAAANVGGVTRITHSSPAPFEVDDSVVIAYWALSTFEGIHYNRQVSRIVLAVPSATQVDVALIVDSYPISSYSTIRHSDYNRDPRQMIVLSTLQHDFFLPGVSAGINDVADIPILQPLLIFGVEGNLTDSFAANSTPTIDEYRAMVESKQMLVAEPSSLTPLRGNIYQRTTRYVTAI
jgi:hypothetical protein